MTSRWISFSILSSLDDFPSSSFETSIPVMEEMILQISSAFTMRFLLPSSDFHFLFNSSIWHLRLLTLSLTQAAFSYSWEATRSRFSSFNLEYSSSSFSSSSGRVSSRIFFAAPASSRISRALSGRNLSLMYLLEYFTINGITSSSYFT